MSTSQTLEIKPNRIYKPIFVGNARYYIAMGGRASGRSYAASQYALIHLISDDYFRCAIMRFVLGDIRNSIFQEIKDRIEEHELEDYVETKENTLTFNFGQNKINGVGFRKSSSDQKSKLKSLASYNTVIIEEADEVAEEDFMQLDDSLRTMKSDIKIILLLNPPDKNNWIIKRWFNLIPSGIEGFYRAELKDSATDVDYIFGTWRDNAKNLNQKTLDNFAKYAETRPDHYYNMIEGLVSEGARGRIFKDWKVISDKEFEELPYSSFYGLDFGFSCVSGGSLISTDKGLIPMKDLEKGDNVLTRKGYKKITSKVNNGLKEVYELDFGYGRIVATGEHLVFTKNGWKRIDHIKNKETLCILKKPNHTTQETHVLESVQVNLQPAKEKTEVFDISVEGSSEFFANGLLVHNCDPAALVEVKEHNNQVWVRELIYETGLTNQRLSSRFSSLGLTKRDIIYADSAEPKSIEELRTEGWNVFPAPKGQDSIRAGIDLLLDKQVSYTEESQNLAYENQEYKWALDKNKEPTNQPVDEYNHSIDGLRYAVFANNKQPFIGIV